MDRDRDSVGEIEVGQQGSAVRKGGIIQKTFLEEKKLKDKAQTFIPESGEDEIEARTTEQNCQT
jgi:hypothetical protein